MVRVDLSLASLFARHRPSSAPGLRRPPPPCVGEAVALLPGASPARGAALGCGGGLQCLAWPGLVPPCSGARRHGRHDRVGHLLPGMFFSYPSTSSSPPLLRLAWPLACLSS
jgi:hypothetical protein